MIEDLSHNGVLESVELEKEKLYLMAVTKMSGSEVSEFLNVRELNEQLAKEMEEINLRNRLNTLQSV